MLKPIPYLLATAIILIALALLVRGRGEDIEPAPRTTTTEPKSEQKVVRRPTSGRCPSDKTITIGVGLPTQKVKMVKGCPVQWADPLDQPWQLSNGKTTVQVLPKRHLEYKSVWLSASPYIWFSMPDSMQVPDSKEWVKATGTATITVRFYGGR